MILTHRAPTSLRAVEQIAEAARAFGLQFAGTLQSGAVFSPCGQYRYLLWRDARPDEAFTAFAMLNPSTADASADDATIRRCRSFARRVPGCDALLVWNLFAFRATRPADLKRAADPVGPLNDAVIEFAGVLAGQTIAAWGTHGGYLDRDRAVLCRCIAAGIDLHALDLSLAGHPKHPLYLQNNVRSQLWKEFGS